MSTYVFINYSKTDESIATKLKEKLDNLDTNCFLDSTDLPAGQNFRIELVKEIKSCSIVLTLLSENYCKSEYANQELGIALGLDKKILPICLDDTLPSAFIDGIQCICCKDTGIDNKIPEIAASLYRILKLERKLDRKSADFYITNLVNSESWEEAGHWAREINSTDMFTDAEINQIGRAVIENGQVQKSWSARPLLRMILLKHRDNLSRSTKLNLESIEYL